MSKQIQMAIISSILFSSCCVKIYKCPNGEPVKINRCKKEEQVTYYAKDYETKVGASIQLSEKILLKDIGVQTKANVVSFREKLNGNTTIIERNLIQYKSQSDKYLCDKEIQNRYLNYMENVTKEIILLGKVNSDLEKQANKMNFGNLDENQINSILKFYNENSPFK